MLAKSSKIPMIVFALVTVLTNFGAVAGTGSTGGGDVVALQFVQSMNSALKRIETKLPLIRARVNLKELNQLVQEVSVVIVQTPLKVKRDGVEQDSTAINDRVAKVIYLNREKWTETLNPLLQEAMALHEYLSIAGLEETGQYFISSAYLRALGELDDPLVLPNRTPAQKNNPEGNRLLTELERVMHMLCDPEHWDLEDRRCLKVLHSDLREAGKVPQIPGGYPLRMFALMVSEEYQKRGYGTFSIKQFMEKFQEEPCAMEQGPKQGQRAITPICLAIAANKLVHQQ